MYVFSDGVQVYSKGGFNPTNPQPTPEEVAVLVEDLFSAEHGVTDGEAADFRALHDAQIKAGKSKH